MQQRSRRWLMLAILLIIPLGLLTRANLPLPTLVARYGGDTLYATLIFFLLAWIWPRTSGWALALAAWSICLLVELSQLINHPWLNAIRATLPGRLVLGAGFVWSDLLCYAVGVGLGVGIDYVVFRRSRNPIR
jgi:hypothetical protein